MKCGRLLPLASVSLLGASLLACALVRVVPPTPTPAPLATSARVALAPTIGATLPLPSPTPTLTATLLPSATSTPGCSIAHGKIEEMEVDARFNTTIELRVYLPPCYQTNSKTRYPVLYLLHGIGHDEYTWTDEVGVANSADKLLKDGRIIPFIIVMPRERGYDYFPDMFVESIVPAIDKQYRTLAERKQRALGGMSRGAGWTLHIGFTHPELFGSLGMHSLALFIKDEKFVSSWLEAVPGDEMPNIYMDIGSEDFLTFSAGYFNDKLVSMGIDHEWIWNEGGEHTFEYWHAHVEEYLLWYSAHFGVQAPLPRTPTPTITGLPSATPTATRGKPTLTPTASQTAPASPTPTLTPEATVFGGDQQ